MPRIIDYAFSGPASFLMWFSILISFCLIGGIPAIVLHMRKFKGLIIAFVMCAIPLALGVIGCVWSLIMMYSALPYIPEPQQDAAYQTGVEVALAYIWITAFITILLALLVWGSNTFAIRLQNNKSIHTSTVMRLTRPLYQTLLAGYYIVINTIMIIKRRKYIILFIMVLIGASLVLSFIFSINRIDSGLFDKIFYNTDLKITKFINDIEPEMLRNGKKEIIESLKCKLVDYRSKFVYSGSNYLAPFAYVINSVYLLIGMLFIILGIIYIKSKYNIRNIINALSIAFLAFLIINKLSPIFLFYPIISIESEISRNLPDNIAQDLPLSFPVIKSVLLSVSYNISLLLYSVAIVVLLIFLNRKNVELEPNNTTTFEGQEGVKD